jgi:hypothetical protein
MAKVAMRLGHVSEARAAATRILDIEPNFSIEAWRRLHPHRDLAGPERIYEALRAVGLRDRPESHESRVLDQAADSDLVLRVIAALR